MMSLSGGNNVAYCNTTLIYPNLFLHFCFLKDPLASLDLVDLDSTPDPVGNFSG